MAELKESMIHGTLFFEWIDKSKRSKALIWISIAIFGIVFYAQMKDFENFANAGKIQPEAIKEKGEWWRLFTGTLMHGAIWHIALNALGFFYIGKFIYPF